MSEYLLFNGYIDILLTVSEFVLLGMAAVGAQIVWRALTTTPWNEPRPRVSNHRQLSDKMGATL